MKFRIIVGLGNPGKEYEHTYHNAGRLFAEYLLKNLFSLHAADKPKSRKPTASKNFEYLKIEKGAAGVSPRSFIFVRPFLFMNESGAAVQAALTFFNVKPAELLVIHDDSDIELGGYKISFGRGAGGHRGVESIIQNIKTKDFWRLRIGIRKANPPSLPTPPKQSLWLRRPGKPRREKASEFVLKKISSADEKVFDSTFQDIQKKFLNNRMLVYSLYK